MARKENIVQPENITVEFVRNTLDYNPATGELSWMANKGTAVKGQLAGYIKNGYRRIRLCSRDYFAHRLVWMHVTGEWPKCDVDHKDRDKLNNRIENLREVTPLENMANQSFSKANKTGYRGVYQRPNGDYYAAIGFEGSLIQLGTYDDPEWASFAYRAGREIFGKEPAPEHRHLEPVWGFAHIAKSYESARATFGIAP